MLLVYSALRAVLCLVHALLKRRVAALERRYVKIAAEADALVRNAPPKPGNSNAPDPLVAARRTLDLARMAVQRDAVERRYATWQAFTEGFGAFRERLASFKGRLVPYAVGVADVVAVVAVMERYGVTLADVRAIVGV